METVEKKKLTLEDLIAKKTEKEHKRNATEPFYVASLDGEIGLTVPEEEVIFKTMDLLEDEDFSNILKTYSYLIYNSVPILRNPELHRAYDVVDPLDIVPKLFDIKERVQLGEQLLKMTGLDELGNDVKN